MNLTTIMDSTAYTWVVLPILIFLARIVDVSMGTIRVTFIAKGFKYLAMISGFFEILIWLSAIRQIMLNLSNPACFIAYSAGFSFGTFCGVSVAEKLALGSVLIRIITKKQADELADHFKTSGYNATSIDAEGPDGPVKVIFMVIPHQRLRQIIKVVQQFNPNAFYSVEDIRFVKKDFFPLPQNRLSDTVPDFQRNHQK